MGVRRLQTFLEQHCPEACYEVSIPDIAEEYRQRFNRDPVIVVDGSCCFRTLYGGLDWVCGGQYKEYVKRVTNFFDSFEAINIKLILYFDGATQESKRPVWVSRRLQSMEKAHAIFDSLGKGQTVQNIDPQLFVLPAGAGNTMSALSKDRCSVRRSLRECDEEIASYAEKNKCFAILAQDSDYVIYQSGAKYYLSAENLDLNKMTTLVYDQKALAEHLLLNVSELPVFASLMGNDFIPADDLRSFHIRLTGKQRQQAYAAVLVRKVAEYVASLPKQNDLFLYLGQLSYEVFRKRNRAVDLKESILSYGRVWDEVTNTFSVVGPIDTRCRNWDQIMSIAHYNYVNMLSPSHVYNILRKLPFEMSTALEDCRTSVPPSAVALRLMRQRIYGVALREYPGGSRTDHLTVDEWCMCGPQSLTGALKVPAILPPENSPKLLDLWLNNTDEIKAEKFKLLSWIGSAHLFNNKYNIGVIPHQLVSVICILSYLYHDANILQNWEVKVFASTVVDVQAMIVRDLSAINVKKVNVRGVQLATMFTRAITHLMLANSICGTPLSCELTRHYQLFDGKMFQKWYLERRTKPKQGNLQHFQLICDTVLTE
ncbi:Constitutive coactivator of peroxisome proliferator-activated receptor gamma [Frankliniella fusca]|uniref:Constitutive coactivator of peroxisome proliferator-activated receptor gamma n=1 Tax=Frankliniella fusca TaxID=407009 RepID=A0AAE1L998_9NEOP|nr:Constitutive coactivator of peroxisome proliferator-activated receptor gamma [Frankliniella fusca]